MLRRLLLAALCLGTAVASTTWSLLPAQAAKSHVTGLSLIASPAITDVGGDVLFVLSAKSWPPHTTVSISFVSPHHGFTGAMRWTPSCSCFKLAVTLARRIHSLEAARATATVRSGSATFTASAGFQIRGLAANGRNYSPGGRPMLTGWVGDPQANPGEVQHFCAWVTTTDGLGVPGSPVRFSVRTRGRSQAWNAGKTSANGLACSHRAIPFSRPGVAVVVDIYAGSLHVQTSYRPHA